MGSKDSERPIGEIMGEIAYLDFVIRQTYADSKKAKSPIEILVDRACNADEKRLKEAKKIIKRIEFLERQLSNRK